MTNDELFNIFINKLSNMKYIHAEDIPHIDLYMDQLTTFMEDNLSQMKRYPEDKILTKTMINNYTKNKLLPPPNKKKYSTDHMVLLIFIYYFKSFLPINDIQRALEPLLEQANSKDFAKLESIYSHIFSFEKSEMSSLKEDLKRKLELSKTAFSDYPEEKQAALQKFMLICLLGFDIYLKKQMIETILDEKEEE
ncbi:hypothetical protein NDGK_00190 [Clostridiales bacterium CHKCI001]|nr:hypothetical protein NDGK_00190 [Clostridiales bacterium CHKCI001]